MHKTPDDINELEKRISRFKTKQKKSAQSSKQSNASMAVANAFRIGTEFIAAVFAGLCFGYALDKFLGTKVIFMLVFSVFGCMAGMLNVYRSAKEMDKGIQEEKD